MGTGGDSAVVGKQLRASGGIILQIEGNQFHLDPGPGALVRLNQAGINPRENTAIFVSHPHLNHCNDVNAVISAMSYNGIDKHGLLVASESVINFEENNVPCVTNFHKKCVERYLVLKEKIGINEIDIFPTETRHSIQGIGFKFQSSKYTISYTSDTEYFPGLADQHEKVDVLIINCKNPFGLEEKGHMNADNVIELIKKAKPKLAIITHFGIKMMNEDPIVVAREINNQVKAQVIAAKDGLVVNPKTFASRVRQQKLKNFK